MWWGQFDTMFGRPSGRMKPSWMKLTEAGTLSSCFSPCSGAKLFKVMPRWEAQWGDQDCEALIPSMVSGGCSMWNGSGYTICIFGRFNIFETVMPSSPCPAMVRRLRTVWAGGCAPWSTSTSMNRTASQRCLPLPQLGPRKVRKVMAKEGKFSTHSIHPIHWKMVLTNRWSSSWRCSTRTMSNGGSVLELPAPARLRLRDAAQPNGKRLPLWQLWSGLTRAILCIWGWVKTLYPWWTSK